MAKQRRTRPKTATGNTGRRSTVAQPVPARPNSVLDKRSSYADAVTLYERGLQALQRREFRAAAEALRGVVEEYPEERELHERARLYLRICDRETGPPSTTPQTLEERVYAATLALNAGAHDQALAHLKAASGDRPANDHVQYMLAVVHTLRGQRELALAHLRRAIDLNPDNRALARQAPDFEPIRNEEGFRQAVEPPPAPPPRRRSRGRAAR